MRKMPISWHEECLGNATAHWQRFAEQVERDQRELNRNRRELEAYAHQIATAKKEGVAEFDREKFMKSRAKRLADQSG